MHDKAEGIFNELLTLNPNTLNVYNSLGIIYRRQNRLDEAVKLYQKAIKISPDLIVSVLTSPATAAAGSSVTVTETTKNQGAGIAAASTTKFYLSTNTAWDAVDQVIGSRSVPQLTYGVTSSGPTSVTIPAGTTPGTYYILAKADAADAVAESSETNNVTYKAITITP